ncbi:MAG: hypothetical protein HOY71_25960 [Nonomuraea sp.]|nr:hypothetical protein [Nonomuraea sp.]
MMKRILAAAAAAVALTGCGVLPGQQAGGGGEEKQRTAAVAPQKETSPTSEPTVAAQPDQAVATRTVKVTNGTAKVDITLLKRQGKVVSLNFTVTAVEGKVEMHAKMGTGGGTDLTLSKVSLIDPVNGKRYRVARNGTDPNAEYLSSSTQGVWPEDGQSATLYAMFGAPPPDVTKVNIEMPLFGTFTDVPLS